MRMRMRTMEAGCVLKLIEKKKMKMKELFQGIWDHPRNRNTALVVLASGFLFLVLPTLVILKPPSSQPDRSLRSARLGEDHVVRAHGYGTSGFLFVHASSYRGGSNTFAVIGLGGKAVHVFGKPGFRCEWIPSDGSASIATLGVIYTPDYGYGRAYTVVVVNCTFAEAVGTGGRGGGKLVVHAWAGENYGENATFVALTEQPGSYNPADYREPYPYKFVYCGSPFYGEINPARIQEWVTYHTKLFGNESLIVLQDAGGMDSAVHEVLKPWVDSGAVVVHDVREQARFDGYYYNQFMLLNVCHQRMKMMAPWMFFFDLDEYLYIGPQYDSLESVMREFSNFTQVQFQQSHMSNKLCLANPTQPRSKQWGFEMLVFRNSPPFGNYKYAIQPQGAMSVGVHQSLNITGNETVADYSILRFYHYHGTINQKNPCKIFVESTIDNAFWGNEDVYLLDTDLQELASSTKQYQMQIRENSHT